MSAFAFFEILQLKGKLVVGEIGRTVKKEDIDILLFSLLFTPDVIEIGQTGKGNKQDFDIFFVELDKVKNSLSASDGFS